MDIKYQIFISSTFDDLKEERRKVIEQILHLGHIPVGMELFQAGDETQWDLIQRRITECDYYIVIVAERYGMEGPGKKSYTQMEYEFALKKKIPTIAFLLHKEARKNWPSDRVEYDQKTKIDYFRSLCQKKIIQYWNNGDDLAAKVVTSLIQQFSDKPRIGWIRANRAANIDTINEMAKLSEEKRELQMRLTEAEKNHDITVPPVISHKLKVLSDQSVKLFLSLQNVEGDYEPIESSSSMLELFMSLSRLFAIGARNHHIDSAICEFLRISNKSRLDFGPALAEYLAMDLLHIVYVTDYTFDKPSSQKVYHLMEAGKLIIMYGEMGINDNLSIL